MKHVAVLLAALAGCTNTTDPTLHNDECVRGHSDMVLTLIPVSSSCGRNCSTVRMVPSFIPIFRCDQSIRFTYPNPNYKKESAK